MSKILKTTGSLLMVIVLLFSMSVTAFAQEDDELIDITVQKVWDDENNIGEQPESVTVYLYQDSVQIDFANLSSANNWTYTWADMPKDANYSVSEVSVEGYATAYDQVFTITNTPIPPEINKVVWENSISKWGSSNTAEIGETVNFETIISAKINAANYVLHDTLAEGLTFGDDIEDSDDIVISVGGIALTEGTQYTINTECTDDCTFEIAFSQDYLSSITEDTDITVAYSATVNSNAVIDGEGNLNSTYLQYGKNSNAYTDTVTTATYVFDLNILKYANGDKSNALVGAEFLLEKTGYPTLSYTLTSGATSLSPVTCYAVVDANGLLTGWTDDDTEATTLTTNSEGKISVKGLDANLYFTTDLSGNLDSLEAQDSYFLEETKAPDGYSQLTEPVEFWIGNDGNVWTYNESEDDYVNSGSDVLEVENETGTELPSTGGIGTDIFYMTGFTLMACSLILLIAKKRAGNIL